MATKNQIETTYVISPPKFATVDLILEGIAPLVVERLHASRRNPINSPSGYHTNMDTW